MMTTPNQTFSSKQLGWMRRWHSQAHLRTASGSRPATQQEWDAFLTRIDNEIAKDEFRFSGVRWRTVRGKLTLWTPTLEDTLVVRKINDNIRRAYGLRQPHRVSLIRTAKQALEENTPKTIVRIDLRGCFESINREHLLKTLKADALLSTQTMALIELLFRQAAGRLGRAMPVGIPRGLTISTSLAELKLRFLDKKMRGIAGTYLYLRYVDDILIFSTAPEAEAMDAARSAVVECGFSVNERKTGSARVACRCDVACPHGISCPCKKGCKCLIANPNQVEIEYLGYKFLFNEHNAGEADKKNSVFCLLSDRKVARLKSRIVEAFVDYTAKADTQLLEDRIRYLMCNQRIAATPGKRGLFNGLAHTHSEYAPPALYAGNGTLEELDRFFRARLRALNKASAVPNVTKLEAMTFKSGFQHHRRTKFDGQRVRLIKSCWKI